MPRPVLCSARRRHVRWRRLPHLPGAPSPVRRTLLVATLLCLPAASLGAQRGGAAPPFDGPRGAFSFELSDGEPVSFYLEWSRMLELTEPQKGALIEIRRRLRVQNAPYMQQLDSLRELAGVDLSTRRRLTERDREALQRFQQLAAPVIDAIRVNNDGARREIRGVLDARQLARADSVQAEWRAGRRQGGDRREERPPVDGARHEAAHGAR